MLIFSMFWTGKQENEMIKSMIKMGLSVLNMRFEILSWTSLQHLGGSQIYICNKSHKTAVIKTFKAFVKLASKLFCK